VSAPPRVSRQRVLRRALVAAAVGVAILAVTGLSLGAAFTARPPGELLAAVRWPWMAAATLFVLIGTGSHGARMRPLLPPPAPPGRLPPRRSLGALYLAASVLNLSFPGPAGEVAAALALGRTHALSPPAVLAASLHARFVALFVAAAGALLGAPFVPLPPASRPIFLGAIGALGFGGGGLALLSLRPGALAAVSRHTVGALAARLPGAAGRLAARLHAQVLAFGQALGAVPAQGPRAYAAAAAWSVLSLLSSFAALLCAGAAFGVHPGPLGAFVTLCLTVIAAVALILLPGGLGTFDLVLVGMLHASAGVSPAEAGLVLLGVRGAQLLSIAVSSLVFFAWAGQLLRAEVLDAMERGDVGPAG
jgi:hypothetical protein